MEIINLITKSDKLAYIQKEETFTEILNLLISEKVLPVFVQVALIDILAKAALRLSAK